MEKLGLVGHEAVVGAAAARYFMVHQAARARQIMDHPKCVLLVGKMFRCAGINHEIERAAQRFRNAIIVQVKSYRAVFGKSIEACSKPNACQNDRANGALSVKFSSPTGWKENGSASKSCAASSRLGDRISVSESCCAPISMTLRAPSECANTLKLDQVLEEGAAKSHDGTLPRSKACRAIFARRTLGRYGHNTKMGDARKEDIACFRAEWHRKNDSTMTAERRRSNSAH